MASRTLKPSTSLLSLANGMPLRATNGRERPAIRAAREYIETHYAEAISIAGLAALVSLSPYHFARVFGREVGLPPHTYLETIRIRNARQSLDRGDTVVSAALSAGFVDQSHLTHRFKRFLGITPGKYAKRNRTRQEHSQSMSSIANHATRPSRSQGKSSG